MLLLMVSSDLLLLFCQMSLFHTLTIPLLISSVKFPQLFELHLILLILTIIGLGYDIIQLRTKLIYTYVKNVFRSRKLPHSLEAATKASSFA